MKAPFFDRVAAIYSKILSKFFVKKCTVCGEVLWEKGELCEECLSLWRKARLERCPACTKTARGCGCRPVSLMSTSRIGKRQITALAFYGKSDDEGKSVVMVRKLIRSLKVSYDRSCVKFVSRELSSQILRILKTEGEDPAEWTVCYPPRSRTRIKKYGFDQGREIAKTVSEFTGIAVENCFVRRGDELQKTLNYVERRRNADSSYYLSDSASPAEKNYIVIDDVITTGATVNAVSKLLMNAGANKVYPMCVARTKMKKRKVRRKVSEKLWFK